MVSEKTQPVTFPAFKNRVMIKRYPNNLSGVFIGIPSTNIFGFFFESGTEMEMVREAYTMYQALLNGDMSDYKAGYLKWGKEIPK
jgi:hypothetical protein